MKKSRFTEDLIIRVLQEVEAGQPINDICLKYGISDQTYYNWKAKYRKWGRVLYFDIHS